MINYTAQDNERMLDNWNRDLSYMLGCIDSGVYGKNMKAESDRLTELIESFKNGKTLDTLVVTEKERKRIDMYLGK